MTQRMTLITSPCYVPESRLHKLDDLQELFACRQPLNLEIGCGIGDFVVQLAEREPQHNFIAIDIFNRGCDQSARRIEEAGLTNVRVLRTEARSLLLHHVKPQSLRAIYINCPDPWPKKRHRKRRLVNSDFLKLALHFLEEEGHFNFSTDFTDYGIEVGELLTAEPGFNNCHATPYTHELGSYPISKYMRRFLELGQPIFYSHYQREPNFAAVAPPAPKKGFRMRWATES
ncbi:tRNA (guanosine(46)-N7)-methyltransferase TrmB [Geopsychrobacter electrodiphilus]|uniref:tRNA (guanosine(46)-N7)-methyltransferase TrmB n=1 Tax=Geopsychrobacter electrodiphilus TaxID=225196 RepID=UPI000376C991|nr:tRNA (guanosine(46)-N7)-methyltransferase TrmB [Geopsychrobacter electrodiphilus]